MELPEEEYDAGIMAAAGATAAVSAPRSRPPRSTSPRALNIDASLAPTAASPPVSGRAGGTGDAPLHRVLVKKSSGEMGLWSKYAGMAGSHHSISTDETEAFANYVSHSLEDDTRVSHLLPLKEDGSDLFSACGDGIIVCLLLDQWQPGIIPLQKLNLVDVQKEEFSVYKRTENCNLAIAGCLSMGLKVVNCGANDLVMGKPTIVCGLLWQIIKSTVMAKIINVDCSSALINLAQPGETLESIQNLPLETKMLRWVNHHLQWSLSDLRVTNLGGDMADCMAYEILLRRLGADMVEFDNLAVRIPQRLAACAVRAARSLGVDPIIAATHITAANVKLNSIFLAQLFAAKPLFVPTTQMEPGIRMLQAKIMYRTLKRRHSSATLVQAIWRGHVGKKVACVRLGQCKAATLAQAAWRAHACKIFVSRRRTLWNEAANVIQRRIRARNAQAEAARIAFEADRAVTSEMMMTYILALAVLYVWGCGPLWQVAMI